LATNPKKYKIIKSKLLNNLDNAPLFNSSLFTKNLESAYEVMFEKFHQGDEPDHIYLDDEPN
jgi:predicted O-linked N-acetylglucosamine transferase (SPINDLY family)